MASTSSAPSTLKVAIIGLEAAITGFDTVLQNGKNIIQTGTEQIRGFGQSLSSMQQGLRTMRPSAMPAVTTVFTHAANELNSFANACDGVITEARSTLQALNAAYESDVEYRIKAEQLSKELTDLKTEHGNCDVLEEKVGWLNQELGATEMLNKQLKAVNAELIAENRRLKQGKQVEGEDRSK